MSRFLTELRCAEALARQAGKRMLREYRQGFEVDMKGKQDLVTEVDLSVERFLTEELEAIFPDDGIFGEEFGRDREEARRQWLIDPIDGTINFSLGIPVSCVSIALQVAGRSVVGVIYDPHHDELFSARRGQGACLDGASVSVSGRNELANSVLATGFPRPDDRQEVDNFAHFANMSEECRGLRRLGSAAIDLAYVAVGRLDGFWEYDLNPWDTAAGYLLVEEAGGRVTDARGGDYTAHENSVVASNDRIHDEIVAVLERQE